MKCVEMVPELSLGNIVGSSNCSEIQITNFSMYWGVFNENSRWCVVIPQVLVSLQAFLSSCCQPKSKLL